MIFEKIRDLVAKQFVVDANTVRKIVHAAGVQAG